MKITAIIPSLYEKDGEYLKLAVESLRATRDWDIIVVTNGSNVKPNLKDIYGISLHVHLNAQGQCHAVNVGAQLANPATQYLFVSNADMYYAPGWDDNLRFDDLVFSPNLVEPNNNHGSAPPFLKFGEGFELKDFKPEAYREFITEEYKHIADDPMEATSTPGFNLPFFVRKDVWETVGGYDRKYDPWGSNSDTDLQTKFNLAGITPKRLRDVLVYHFSNKSGTFDGTHQEEWQQNWEYFNRKWGFNRDDLKSDVWMNKDMLPDADAIMFKPDWVNKYKEQEDGENTTADSRQTDKAV